MTLWAIVVTGAVVVAFARGLRATSRLVRRWRATSAEGRSMILWAFVVVAASVTVAAGWVGLLSVRRILGFAPLDWSAGITTVLAIALFFIPEFLDHVVDRIERGRA